MTEDFPVILRKSHENYGRKLAGFSDRFTSGGLIISNTYGKKLVQCHIDYCSQLYMLGQARGKQEIEKQFLQFNFKNTPSKRS